ncbi:DNA helicase RecQ [Patescibacteria group bacterium]|nr:DNA helicase RecQ [Patescibacteria group bacterium]MCG2701999.1 DNA helicase RecQ [Candidatus Parcubacteria bacterium]MBU4264814.1 DNA helicase RecQ [Patescibacteria group bacterium]MBU4389836.1 DNA helicase RecQ [Patescibacteria group bacterium]MBU4396989.1 DNA helicase RecQ [Patescibacteria group bacterium]
MLKFLKKYFGYDSFLPLQKEVIDCVIDKNDALVLMPTGGGKSVCYQLPALMLDGVSLVVSPLIALMKDQVDGLKANGIEAEFINSSQSLTEINIIQKRAQKGEIKILYLAPERLVSPDFQDFLRTLNLNLIAIDEAHCISEWGHDFRPSYRSLIILKQNFPKIPILALTATATEKVRQDIVKKLGLKNAKVFISSFNRPNLNYIVKTKKNAYAELVNLLKKYEGKSSIVYCFSRKKTEELADDLKNEGLKALAYHAGLDKNLRRKTQEKFIQDEIQIIVATIAFGMGIDKPDVRLVVHYSLPKSVEGYYQETGRAGRDGLPSECVLFYSYGDLFKHEYFLKKIKDEKERVRAKIKLEQMIKYCELNSCRRRYLLKYFGESLLKDCNKCDICLNPVEKTDATIIVQKILCGVIRTGERFGGRYIVDVLRGSLGKRIKLLGHDKLSVFGVANENEKNEIKYYINLIVVDGLLTRSEGEYPTLAVSDKGRKFLKLREKIMLPKARFETGLAPKKGKKTKVEEYETELFEELRVMRKELAVKNSVPAYIIFGDVSLKQMAYFLPQDLDGFLRISGVGAEKLKKFGEKFLKIIKRYSEKHGLSERFGSF